LVSDGKDTKIGDEEMRRGKDEERRRESDEER
jgi:hypothetical protein